MINNYKIHSNGVIEQIEKKSFVYDVCYVKNYNNYGGSIELSTLRLENIKKTINRLPQNILDVGYGNGDFIRHCLKSNIQMYGTDISNYPIPDNSKFIPFNEIFNIKFDVITFYDSLEHFWNIDFILNLQTNYVVISLPWCHNFSDEWFENWKHRKPDEHIWHFNDETLTNFMKQMNFKLVSFSNIEDIVRKPADDNNNILTAIYRKI